MLFQIDIRIMEMYKLKEDYISFNRYRTANDQQLNSLIKSLDNSGISSFKKIKNFEVKL